MVLKSYNYTVIQNLILYLSSISAISILLLLLTILISITINTKFQNTFKNITFIRIVKKFNLLILLVLLFLVIVKILISLIVNNLLEESINITLNLQVIDNNYSFNFLNINSLFSDCIILLAYISGGICIYLLGERNLVSNVSNITFFSIFLVLTIIMVNTTNILTMFIAFEFTFIPTIYYVYILGYTKKVNGAIKFLFMWTLSGAFLVLITLMYIYIQFKTLDYYELLNVKFTKNEITIIGFSVFLGFGVKIPVFPFHYWLTKIHVEAPAGFSIFLSGFLVKAAAYCLSVLLNIFMTDILYKFIILISLVGIIESSCKLWTQTDVKKTIAFATIQEMNIILMLLITFSNIINYAVIIFVLMHGLLSTMMFFMVDVIQKKTGTRDILEIGGIGYLIPKIKIYIWIVLVFMAGFPLTVKFVVESFLVDTLLSSSFFLTSLSLLLIVAVGILGFIRQFLIILYNVPSKDLTINTVISKRDDIIFITITCSLVILNLVTLLIY